MENKHRNVIKAPIISEKVSDLRQENKYVFSVDLNANKVQIKQAIENIFNVKVVSVNTINVKPKKKRVGRRYGKRNRVKKAIVTLQPGNTIEI